MLVSNIYSILSDLINYIYSDGYFSVKALTFYAFVLFFYYEICKDFFYNINIEMSYYKEDDIPKGQLKQSNEIVKKSIKIEEEKIEPKEQLQLYKIFKNQK